tara:strand:+ start:528 stop:1046 length:519 start_codon:yes stop_codon:yes gene_type:complete
MAIKDTSRKPYISDNDTNIKIGIDLPIRRGGDSDGFFATTSTTIEAVKNNIKNILNTEKGERFFQPNLGMGLRKFLFQNITDETTIGIQNEILDVLEYWLPFVEVRNIEVLTTNDDSSFSGATLNIKIIFNIKQDPNTLDSVQITVSEESNDVDLDLNSGETTTISTGGGGY